MEVRDGQRQMNIGNRLRHGVITMPQRTGMMRLPWPALCQKRLWQALLTVSLSGMLFFLAASPAFGETVTVRKLSGQSEEGELSGLSATEITLRATAGKARIPVEDALDVTVPGNTWTPSEGNYGELELTDGSVLRCTEFATRLDQVLIKLLSGTEVKLPLQLVSSYLSNAQDARVRQEWQGFLAKRGNTDLLAVPDASGKINVLEGTFGTGDDSGTSIAFESSAGVKRQLSLSRIHAMAFMRRSEAEKPRALCKVHDTFHDLVVATAVDLEANRLRIASVGGARLELPLALIVRLDYSLGKLTYLSDLEPAKVLESSNVDRIEHYRRDKNLDDRPLSLIVGMGPRPQTHNYAKGLAMHATTELVYDIGGQYKQLKGLVGVDPTVGGASRVKVQVEGDGRELFQTEVERGQAARPVDCDVTNVHRLRILVEPAALLDLSNHVNFAEARVSN